MPRYRVTGEPVGRHECSRGVAGATAETGTQGNAFRQREMNGKRVTSRLECTGCPPHRQVLLHPPGVRAHNPDGDPAAVPTFRHERVRQTDQTKQRLETVVSIVV